MIPVLLGAIVGYIFSAIVAPNPDQFQASCRGSLVCAATLHIPQL